jgi:hypothetical protein
MFLTSPYIEQAITLKTPAPATPRRAPQSQVIQWTFREGGVAFCPRGVYTPCPFDGVRTGREGICTPLCPQRLIS